MAEIKHRLDLVVRTFDTTTGREIGDAGIRFYKDGEPFHMAGKEPGTYFVVDMERKNFSLRVNIQGYEEKEVFVDYEKIDAHLPEVKLFMLPINGLSLYGKLVGISELQAADEDASYVFISSFDAKKKVVRLFNPHNVTLREPEYAILHRETDDFEIVEQNDEDTKINMKVKDVLHQPFKVNDPVVRITHGEVEKDGSYLLRVNDDGAHQNFLVRFVVNGETFFQHVDFNNVKENELKCDKRIEKPPESEVVDKT